MNNIVSHPSHRAGRQAAQAHIAPPPAPVHVHHAPHAALLIDFDNVTLGIRSDLTKELRTLLNSDIIRGKVAVQRAYADWRRYPQYIVPLSESSIDLIFAPAFGTNKKNATDIRLAVDATELVFIRPEIGTFILLSGDSDFSSLVLKLKEYGKYVIGVGIRESASDLLIQNCDEYYSYSDLAGLTKEADTPSAQRDPWELVGEAVAQMARNGDVMRSDRLKQVMQQIDPNFDERNAGFNRFSKFVSDAGAKGLLKVAKLDNGQFEVAPIAGAAAPAGRGAKPPAGDRERGSHVAAPSAERPERPEGRGRRGRGRGRGRGGEAAAERAAPSAAHPPRPAAPARDAQLTLAAAFLLMSRARGELPSPVGGEALRARMAALHGKEDTLLDTERFARLLRQANDAEIADVRLLGDKTYEVSLHRTSLGMARNAAAGEPQAGAADGNGSAPATGSADAGGVRTAALRFRRGSRAPVRPRELPLVGMVKVDDELREAQAEPVAPPAEATAAAANGRTRKRGGSGARKQPAPATDQAGPAETVEPRKPRRPRAKKSG
ncbi:MAG TPA: NYN domain-containing protein [Gemmatimonadales bacterium]|nr:NYN domain-containing protein [Gemmatimonadales bacterium]